MTRRDPAGKVLFHAARHAALAHRAASVVERASRDACTIDDLKRLHPDVYTKGREVQNIAYRVKAYTRLVPWQDDLVLAGIYPCLHSIEALVGNHFARRFPASSVITVNRTTRCGCVSLGSRIPVASILVARQWASSRLVASWKARLLSPAGGLLNFSLDFGETPEQAIESLVSSIYPLSGYCFDATDFQDEWRTFYDSQLVEGRVNYRYAKQMLGVGHAKALLDSNDVVIQRVLKRVPKNQKSLLDY